MCGIAGMVGPGAGSHLKALEAMLVAMHHRGPDGTGIYQSPTGNCLLGHTRLAIIDPSILSAQPFTSSCKNFSLVYNGECYNFPQLKHELEAAGEKFISLGDTELVLKIMALYGTAGLCKLNGMFALAFWDESKQMLLMARDYYGQKPLYYTLKEGILIFASEVRALLASGLVPRQLSPEGVLSYLSYGCVQPPHTIVKSVQALGSHSFVRFSRNAAFEESSWEFENPAGFASLRELFSEAVRRHLLSDVPIGIFLSGGIDSSAIVAAARNSVSGPLHTLSVTFPDDPTYSEGHYSRAVASIYETDHKEIQFSKSDILKLLPAALDAMDQPTVDGINTFIVSNAAHSAGLKVALSGLGGDEIFGGYPSFVDLPRVLQYRRILPLLAKAVRSCALSEKLDHRWAAKLCESLECDGDIVSLYLVRRRMFPANQLRRLRPGLVSGQWFSALDENRLAQLMDECKHLDSGDAISKLEMSIYMEPMLLRDSDSMGMSQSLEIRVPFLDVQFSAKALSIDAAQRLDHRTPKRFFVDSLGDWLPDNVTRRPKQGFVLPLQAWMRSVLNDEMMHGLSALNCVSTVETQAIWRKFLQQPERVGWVRPWLLYVLGSYILRHRLSD